MVIVTSGRKRSCHGDEKTEEGVERKKRGSAVITKVFRNRIKLRHENKE